MRIFKYIIVLSFLFLTARNSNGGDLAILTIKNDMQVEIAESIVKSAFTSADNKFLIYVESVELGMLRQSGLDVNVILNDADVSGLSLVYPSSNPQDKFTDIGKFGNAVSLFNGLTVSPISATMAASISQTSGYKVVPLESNSVDFYYIPESISSSLSGIEDFPYDSLAALVSQDSIYAYNTRLEAFQTRYIYTDSIDAARDWLVQKFLDWGYTDVTTPHFLYNGIDCYNVMVVKPGYAEPDKVIVVGGHYDSITNGTQPGPMTFAPGSDDNGSGTTATLELARILADVPLRKTVIFIPFSAEEVGLVGASNAAQGFLNSGTDVEVMFNFDMIGYCDELNPNWNLNITSGVISGYRNFMAAAAERLTPLTPQGGSSPGSSDHAAFAARGFNHVFVIEGGFNTLGWHTNLDITSRMNFDYMTDVIKMAAASIGHTANSASITEITEVIDQGDGQSLEIRWDDDCNAEYTYKLIYGETSGIFTDTIDIPSGLCSHILTGLNIEQRYYFSIVGEPDDGVPAIYTVQASGVPLLVPLAPNTLNIEPGLNSVILSWAANKEADLSYYNIYRKDNYGYQLIGTSDSAAFEDTDVVGQYEYEYIITAVDFDGYESGQSTVIKSYAGTFDGGMLAVDEINIGNPMPDQAGQEAYIANVFNGLPYSFYNVSLNSNKLTKANAGRYSSVLWFDDDLNNKLIPLSNTTLDWFCSFETNICITGFRTLEYWEDSPYGPGDLMYDEFNIAGYTEHTEFDFAGAFGDNGFPDLEVNPANPFVDTLPFIAILEPRPGATVIYRYNSFSDDMSVEGEPCAVMYDSPNGKRIILGFPLYFLTEESAQNFIAYLSGLFGETFSMIPGDINNSNGVDIADLVYLVNYTFLHGGAPLDLNTADVNGSCTIDVVDLVYLVDYLFGLPSGPEPVPGCVY